MKKVLLIAFLGVVFLGGCNMPRRISDSSPHLVCFNWNEVQSIERVTPVEVRNSHWGDSMVLVIFKARSKDSLLIAKMTRDTLKLDTSMFGKILREMFPFRRRSSSFLIPL